MARMKNLQGAGESLVLEFENSPFSGGKVLEPDLAEIRTGVIWTGGDLSTSLGGNGSL